MAEIILPRARRHQLPLLESPARFKVAACGRRWGKTLVGLMAVVQGHGPAFQFKGADKGGNIWWVAPSYKIAAEIWLNLKFALREGWTKKNEVDMRIDLPSGGAVTVRSADNPDSLRGVGLDGLVVDEAGFIADDRAWQEALRPTLADRKGWALFIGTPNKDNWFYELWKHAGETPNWERWQLPTADNPFIEPEEIENARENLGGQAFRQEWLAEFLTPDEIAIFKRHWWQLGRIEDPYRGVISVDLAHEEKTTADYTDIAVWRTNGHQFERCDGVHDRLQFPEVERAITDLRTTYRYPVVLEDQSNTKPLIQRLQRSMWGIVPWRIRGRSKMARASAVTSIVEAGNCFLPPNENWVKDFIEEHAQFPLGKHDDMVDTTTMALLYLVGTTRAQARQGGTPYRSIMEEVRA